MIPDHLQPQVSKLPQGTGVYLFRDRDSKLLYVGKSKALRTRVSSYFRGDPREKDLRLQRMVHDIRNIEHLCSSNELLALLLEDSLIKHGDPVYNLRQNKYRKYIYLRFTKDQYPRLKVVPQSESSGDVPYGPFPDEFFLPRLEAFLGRHYGLRNCHEKNPSSICVQADLGLCLAPCADVAGAKAYPTAVDRVHKFLMGEDESILSKVKTEMDTAVQQEQYEHAGRCRDELKFATAYLERMKFTREFVSRTLTLKIDDDLSCSFVKGDLQKIHSEKALLDGDQYLVDEAPLTDDRFLLDRAYILHRWISRFGLAHHFA